MRNPSKQFDSGDPRWGAVCNAVNALPEGRHREAIDLYYKLSRGHFDWEVMNVAIETICSKYKHLDAEGASAEYEEIVQGDEIWKGLGT